MKTLSYFLSIKFAFFILILFNAGISHAEEGLGKFQVHPVLSPPKQEGQKQLIEAPEDLLGDTAISASMKSTPYDLIRGPESFGNLYNQIYERTNFFDDLQNQKACFRLHEWKQFESEDFPLSEFTCTKDGKFEGSEIWQLEQGFYDPALLKKVHGRALAEEWSAYVRDFLAFEKDTLGLEDDLKWHLGKMSLFADRNMQDQSYDLIEDLDDIDEILFGEKHTRPKPSFSFFPRTSPGEFDDKTKEDEWQIGFKQDHPAGDSPSIDKTSATTHANTYSMNDPSIASQIANMKWVLDFRLTPYPQSGQKSSKSLDGPSGWDYYPDMGSTEHQEHQKASIQKREAELEITQGEIIGERFAALEEKIFTDTRCGQKTEEDREDSNISNDESAEAVNECETIREEEWNQRFDALQKAATLMPENIYLTRLFPVIQDWNSDFEAWRWQIIDFKEIFRRLSEECKVL